MKELKVPETVKPVPLEKPRIRQAAQLLADAFSDDTLFCAALPQEEKRRRVLLWLHEKVVLYSVLYGEAHTTPALEAVACWLPPGRVEVTAAGIVRTGFYTMLPRMGLRTCLRFSRYMSYSDGLRRENAPDRYWYLWVLGVRPQEQGRGLGGGLIRPLLARADAEGVACFLETEKEENVRFYGKHGFAVAAEGTVPGVGVRMWSLLRRPRRSARG